VLASAAVKAHAEEQLRILLSGAERVIPQDDLARRLTRALDTGTGLRVKLGIDPSAPDIHLGHTVVLRKLRRFQQLGHTAVLIIGDFTGLIGDPSGQSETRRSLSAEEARANATTYVDQVSRILLPERLEVRWNSEWLDALGTTGLLELASQMTVARMLERDDFAKRYAGRQPVSIVEFLYPLLQGYDSVAVRCDVELGGTDQTFNLLVGRDLQQRAGQDPQVAFTLPLLEGLDGAQKMSKSLGNTVGVTDAPEEMYGKLMSIPDPLIGKYLRLVTDMHPDEVSSLEAAAASGGKGAADAKRRLASEVVSLYHSAAAAADAGARFDTIHVRGELPSDVPERDLPGGERIALARLISSLRLAPSTSEARRKIQQRAVRLDDELVTDPTAEYQRSELAGKVLRVGKRAFVRLRAGS
jgi:tyrosyl-tRNA synthetase